jgi:hypothetical protein
MSTESTGSMRNEYEESFLDQNTWIRPVVIFDIVCFALLGLIVGAHEAVGWFGARFGQVIFGMVASMILMSLIFTTVLLVVNGSRYIANRY